MSAPWRPLRHYVLKVASRCDLACDHCYVYEHADQSWRGRPPLMSLATASVAARRIAEHAAAHDLAQVSVILHGGEPLLLGPARLRALLTELRGTIGAVCRLDLRMQTNGVRLDAAHAEVLLEAGVRVGVSLDGDRSANDRHRVFRRGASSYERTLRGIGVLRSDRFRSVYAGLLCTVDIANDPVAVYASLIEQDPPRIDLLLPHGTWAHPPVGLAERGRDGRPYARWLLAVHERWVADGRPVPIRLFDSLGALAVGGPSGTEAVGIDAGDLVVIETDGAWEEPDSMKTTWDGAGATGLTIFEHSADEVTAQPAMRRRRAGMAALSSTCRACEVVRQCGGGLRAHRYRPDSGGDGFENPSVYCDDLKELIITLNSQPAPPSIGSLPSDVFDQIAYGFGDARAVEALAAEELAINRALVGEVIARFGGRGLPELERSDPVAFNAAIGRPYVRAWAVRCLEESSPDLDRMDSLGESPDRFVSFGGSTIVIDDADPYRDVFGFPVAEADDSPWEAVLAEAWEVILTDAPSGAEGLRRGIKVITPLAPPGDGTQRSATSRDAFGAVGIAFTPKAEDLAVLLVHEFQHTKLGAVLDLIDLVDPNTPEHLSVGWRPDPRPVEAALQGAYAHLAIADMWRRRSEREPGLRARYTMYRDWTAEAIAALRAGDGLTPAGRHLTTRMAATVDGWH
ncbi:FxsB family cyclophane-forming radical SAM/SPASM peptide maturase [Actinoplanes subtropicus]|uniref:FxsB family cyclophane-forming radical SAM/SPASM peptide maturase n=1 Tax=Actinoplanes subtropicus TaxID=543632 RepID=UPI0004C47740|nr:FxsB family cyclophane-forming radical SAM/SPASM peptide maturase [Actinoplanes subtropicus]